ncbi:hypothetical protein VCSRO160_0526 [Vibrio cholerae]|nr:hypothetical protein VCSRO160_0526 [Vibrio cholerae]
MPKSPPISEEMPKCMSADTQSTSNLIPAPKLALDIITIDVDAVTFKSA